MFKIAYSDNYYFTLPEGHKFPIQKYDLLPRQLMYEGTVNASQFFDPELIDLSRVERVHDRSYVDQFTQLKLTPREQRVTGFVHDQALVERELTLVEGTRMCAIHALKDGIAFNIAGGTHHAYSNRGEGFCMLNDQAIAAQALIDDQLAGRILIVDLDVHQGQGTAEIFQHSNEIFTFSMHGKNNYPLRKERSYRDIELEDACTGKDYLDILERELDILYLEIRPDFIFFQSGVDVLKTDKLGRLALSIDECKQRDEYVLSWCVDKQLPVVCTMGGGYSPDIKTVVEAHANTYRVASQLFF